MSGVAWTCQSDSNRLFLLNILLLDILLISAWWSLLWPNCIDECKFICVILPPLLPATSAGKSVLAVDVDVAAVAAADDDKDGDDRALSCRHRCAAALFVFIIIALSRAYAITFAVMSWCVFVSFLSFFISVSLDLCWCMPLISHEIHNCPSSQIINEDQTNGHEQLHETLWISHKKLLIGIKNEMRPPPIEYLVLYICSRLDNSNDGCRRVTRAMCALLACWQRTANWFFSLLLFAKWRAVAAAIRDYRLLFTLNLFWYRFLPNGNLPVSECGLDGARAFLYVIVPVRCIERSQPNRLKKRGERKNCEKWKQLLRCERETVFYHIPADSVRLCFSSF